MRSQHSLSVRYIDFLPSCQFDSKGQIKLGNEGTDEGEKIAKVSVGYPLYVPFFQILTDKRKNHSFLSFILYATHLLASLILVHPLKRNFSKIPPSYHTYCYSKKPKNHNTSFHQKFHSLLLTSNLLSSHPTEPHSHIQLCNTTQHQ